MKSTHRAFAVNLPTDLLTMIHLCGTVKAVVEVTLVKRTGQICVLIHILKRIKTLVEAKK